MPDDIVVDAKKTEEKDTSKPDEVSALKLEIEQLKNEKKEWQTKNSSLNDKVKTERENQDKKASESKSLEHALMFNLKSAEFLKTNESVLPKEIGEIFRMAEREKYESAIEKANATKAAIVQAFFNQQANTDFLTDIQKETLSEYLKLTKTGKEEKAREIYDNLFEPALSTLKRVKKAEELSRSKMGFRDSSNGDSQYKDKLISLSKHHYLGEKS